VPTRGSPASGGASAYLNRAGIAPAEISRRRLFPFHRYGDRWVEHFVFEGVRIRGITASGRATNCEARFPIPGRLPCTPGGLRHSRTKVAVFFEC
jgi:hypothetical protein